jgi:hypothetical protein
MFAIPAVRRYIDERRTIIDRKSAVMYYRSSAVEHLLNTLSLHYLSTTLKRLNEASNLVGVGPED